MKLFNLLKGAAAALCIAASVISAASCDRINPDDPDNYVRLSVTDVSNGRFTVNFDCGKNTGTVEYAVCRAVNMWKDSAAFAAGTLENVSTLTPEDGKASVPFDFSDPLDIGPYTIYARAVSANGSISRFVKKQVCALTAGLTLDYFSRARYDMTVQYHGDETIVTIWRLASHTLYERYGGSIEKLKKEMLEDSYSDYVYPDGFVYIDQCRQYIDTEAKKTGLDEKTIVGFVTSDGSSRTGAYVIEMPLPDKDPSIPLPEDLTIEYDMTESLTDEEGYNYILSNIAKGSNTDVYYVASFTGTKESILDFGNELMKTYPEYVSTPEEALRWNITSGLFGYSATMYIKDHTEYRLYYSGADYEAKNLVIVACPVNINGEYGNLSIVQVDFPDDWFDAETTAAPSRPKSGPAPNSELRQTATIE